MGARHACPDWADAVFECSQERGPPALAERNWCRWRDLNSRPWLYEPLVRSVGGIHDSTPEPSPTRRMWNIVNTTPGLGRRTIGLAGAREGFERVLSRQTSRRTKRARRARAICRRD